MPEISLGIIGTAFRKDDASKCSKPMFDAMVVVSKALIEQINECDYKLTHLISGGACGADFVAVHLFLEKVVPNLRLFLPAAWENGIFKDDGPKSPGNVSNYYHHQFKRATGINSLSQMHSAKSEGAEFIVVEKGFYARNYLVAKSSDFLLACTFGKGSEVKDGGTADTVSKYLERVRKGDIFDKSFHYDLTSGQVYVGCTVPKIVTKI